MTIRISYFICENSIFKEKNSITISIHMVRQYNQDSKCHTIVQFIPMEVVPAIQLATSVALPAKVELYFSNSTDL